MTFPVLTIQSVAGISPCMLAVQHIDIDRVLSMKSKKRVEADLHTYSSPSPERKLVSLVFFNPQKNSPILFPDQREISQTPYRKDTVWWCFTALLSRGSVVLKNTCILRAREYGRPPQVWMRCKASGRQRCRAIQRTRSTLEGGKTATRKKKKKRERTEK